MVAVDAIARVAGHQPNAPAPGRNRHVQIIEVVAAENGSACRATPVDPDMKGSHRKNFRRRITGQNHSRETIIHIHYLQHAAFEDAANIAVWAQRRGHQVTHTRLDLNASLPEPGGLDWLVVMGGPMNVDEHETHPWLAREKEFIRRMIDRGVRVLGVCLGGQLISSVLGGRVVKNRQKEIGWFPVTLTDKSGRSSLLSSFSRELPAFHWHGDTFSIPAGGVRLAASEGCDNQAFQYGQRVVSLQFHWDYSLQSVEAMIRHCGEELIFAPGIQRPDEMLARPERFDEIQRLLDQLLDNMAAA
jgi:GMP synthase-like glutamine amidotransferase